MQTIQLDPYKLTAVGTSSPPPDLLDAAKRSLSDHGFNDLLNQTGGATPSVAQLCAAVEQERSSGMSPQT